MILNIQNRYKQYLRWSIPAALFAAPRGKLKKLDKTWVSQIDKLKKQNPNLTIDVFGWEKERGDRAQ